MPAIRAQADSQMFIMLSPRSRMERQYTVFGQVISGMDVVQQAQR